MARMIPAIVPEYTESRAEKALFPVFRDGLDDSYTVFHSFELLTRNLQKKFIDGEIDYLIFSPDRGFLILEVKGGSIRYDGATGIWYQNDRPMRKSPFEQAVASKYQLHRFLTKRLNYEPKITYGHAVCFPDVFGNIKTLPSGAEPDICVTGQNLTKINSAVVRIMDSFQKFQVQPMDDRESERIRQILMPHCEYGTSLLDKIGKAKQRIFALTENQCRFLDFIRRQRHALIEGCAGSGKTVMVVKKARELAAEGKSVLLLAFNRMIGEHLAQTVADLTNVTASNYHKYCFDRLKEAGTLPDPPWTSFFFQKKAPELFVELISENLVQYDAVIVDEGQDFTAEYWITIESLVKPEGYFYIFYDPDQNLFGTEMEFPITGEPFILTDNCRNPRTIFNALKPYTRSETHLIDDAPEGEKVVEFSSPDARVRRKELGRILHKLVNEQGIKREQIVVLGGHSIGRTCIGDDHRIGNFYLTEGPEDKPGVIHYHTYMKFKGCEADAVIILDVDPDDDRWSGPMGLYTAISRAQHLLYILWVK